MTRLSAPTLYQCPACAGYFTRSAVAFLHYHNDVPEWSDGMNGQRWAGLAGPVGRCPSCSKVVWEEDAKAVMQAPKRPRAIGAVARLWHRAMGDREGRLRDEREWAALPPEIKQAERIDGLQTAQDFIDALALLSADAEDREVYLRRRLWWVSNDHQRIGTDGTPAASQPLTLNAETRANMLRLLELFEDDPKQQVERGELLRQLGRYDEAVAVLTAVKPDGLSEVKASKIQRLAKAQVTELRVLDHTLPGTRVW